MRVSLIAAVAANGVIGDGGELPWHYPQDLQHFKRVTTGSPVIMGRVTFEGICDNLGSPLPDRTSIVLTSSPNDLSYPQTASDNGISGFTDVTEVHTATSVDEALSIAHVDYSDVVYVAGGESVYQQFLPVADELLLTEIHDEYDGDVTFPSVQWDDWVEVDRSEKDELSFVTYHRASSNST